MWSWLLSLIARHVWRQNSVILSAPIVHELLLLLLLMLLLLLLLLLMLLLLLLLLLMMLLLLLLLIHIASCRRAGILHFRPMLYLSELKGP